MSQAAYQSIKKFLEHRPSPRISIRTAPGTTPWRGGVVGSVNHVGPVTVERAAEVPMHNNK